MDDDIKLPPLPNGVIPGWADWIDDVRRAAVRYDRECRAKGDAKGDAKPDAKPVVHEARLGLSRDGFAWTDATLRDTGWVVATVTLRWTDDGRVWIDSERNRELARRLRIYPSANYNTATAMSEQPTHSTGASDD